MYDVAQHFTNRVVDLLVDSSSDILIGIVNSFLDTLAVVIEFQEVLRTDIIAVAGINFVMSFELIFVRVFATISEEAVAMSSCLLFAFKLVLSEVTTNFEF